MLNLFRLIHVQDRAGGDDNDGLIRALTDRGVFGDDDTAIKDAFSTVDRLLYAPNDEVARAYRDTPLRSGHFHMSAPHMYGMILKHLKLAPGQSFLNVGSGTGYLSQVATVLLGPNGVSHGIEIHEDVVEFAEERQQAYFAGIGLRRRTSLPSTPSSSSSQSQSGPPSTSSTSPSNSTTSSDTGAAQSIVRDLQRTAEEEAAAAAATSLSADDEQLLAEDEADAMSRLLPPPSHCRTQFLHGDCFDLSPPEDHENQRYDRIYVGAGTSPDEVRFFRRFLALGGRMVVPCGNHLLEVERRPRRWRFAERDAAAAAAAAAGGADTGAGGATATTAATEESAGDGDGGIRSLDDADEMTTTTTATTTTTTAAGGMSIVDDDAVADDAEAAAAIAAAADDPDADDPRDADADDDANFTIRTLSFVAFAPLCSRNAENVVVPRSLALQSRERAATSAGAAAERTGARPDMAAAAATAATGARPRLAFRKQIWTPAVHASFPSGFRAMAMTLLCMHARDPDADGGVFARLPKDVVLYILSYCGKYDYPHHRSRDLVTQLREQVTYERRLRSTVTRQCAAATAHVERLRREVRTQSRELASASASLRTMTHRCAAERAKVSVLQRRLAVAGLSTSTTPDAAEAAASGAGAGSSMGDGSDSDDAVETTTVTADSTTPFAVLERISRALGVPISVITPHDGDVGDVGGGGGDVADADDADADAAAAAIELAAVVAEAAAEVQADIAEGAATMAAVAEAEAGEEMAADAAEAVTESESVVDAMDEEKDEDEA